MSDLAIRGGKPIRAASWPRWPDFDTDTERTLCEVLASGRWSLSGPNKAEKSYEQRFSESFSRYIGLPFCVPTANGSSALTTAFGALGIGYGDKVLVPGLTWVACASAVMRSGATPVIVDVHPDTLCISGDAVESALKSHSVAGILLVHLYCNPVDIQRFTRISIANRIPLIEDCSHVHGACFEGKKAGSFGRISIFSMQQTKLLTSGEGGAALTSDPDLYNRLQQLRADGRIYTEVPELDKLDIIEKGDVQGCNHSLSEFHAAILLDRLKVLDSENERRSKSAKKLNGLLREVDFASSLDRNKEADSPSYYKYCIKFDMKRFPGVRIAKLAEALSLELNIQISPIYPALSKNRLFKPSKFFRLPAHRRPVCPRLPIAERASEECVGLPHNALLGTSYDLQKIVEAIKKVHDGRLELSAF